MDPRKGDRIVVGSERVGMPERRGTVLQVIASPWGASYRVRWDDGHETTFRPGTAPIRVLEHVARPTRSRTPHAAHHA